METTRPYRALASVISVTLAPSLQVGSVSTNPFRTGSTATATLRNETKENEMTSSFVNAALDALRGMGTEANLASLAKDGATSYRNAFATACLDGARLMGVAGLDDIKGAFDNLSKAEKDPVKGAVGETLGVIRYVMAGNVIPARHNKKGEEVHPAAATLADLLASKCAISTYVKAWREAKGAAGSSATEAEREAFTVLGAGINALGLANGANVPDALLAFAKGDDYMGKSRMTIMSAGDDALASQRHAEEQEAAKAAAQDMRAKVVEYLASLGSEDMTEILDQVAELTALPLAANG